MIENAWAGTTDTWRYDLLEPRLQVYGDAAIASYTMMVSMAGENGITHRTHNESRVLVKRDGRWQVVHVHKSPAWPAPFQPG
jgi:ketosteroid isomerase-like protein